MIFALIGLVIFLIGLLIAVRIGVNKDKGPTEVSSPMIHNSGIYSIVRRSPREHIHENKPTEEAIRKYLSEQIEDSIASKLSDKQKNDLINQWKYSLEKNIAEIELGDANGAKFYSFHFSGDDPICKSFVVKGQFVSREQLFKYPKIIPPFHLGCRCELKQYHGTENLRDTAVTGMKSFFEESRLPVLPDWKKIILPA